MTCHWCTALNEPHEAHAVAKGYFDLVFANDQMRDEISALKEPWVVHATGLAEPLETLRDRRATIATLFSVPYHKNWARQEARWAARQAPPTVASKGKGAIAL